MLPKHVLLSICAFIRVHFGCLGKFSQHSPFRCIHIFFKNWLWSVKFFKEKLEVISFQKHIGFFSYTTYHYFFIFLPFFFFPLFFFFFTLLSFVYFLSLFPFFSFSLWKDRANEGAHYLLTSNHKVNEKIHEMVSRKKRWRNNWDP